MLIYKEIKPFFRYNPTRKKGAGGDIMRKVAAAVFLLFGFAQISKASDIVLNSSSVVNGVLPTTRNTDIDLNFNHVDDLSVQVIYSSANAQAVTFGDGSPSTGSIRVLTLTGLTTAFATDKITVTQAAAVASTGSITILSTTGLSGQTLSIAGKSFVADTDWLATGVSTSASAKNLAALLQGYPSLFISSSSNNIAFATASVAGLAGNAYNLSSSSPTVMRVSGTTFLGGLEKTLASRYITVGVNTSTMNVIEGVNWTQLDVASNTAVSICTSFNTLFSSVFTSTVSPGSAVIFTTATTAGTAGNAFSLTSSTSAITILTASFANGQDNAVLKFGGFPMTANVDFQVAGTTAATAVNISSAINKLGLYGGLSAILISTVQPNTNLVYTTSTVVGAWTNLSLFSSTPTALVISGPFLSSGTDSDITYNSYLTGIPNDKQRFFLQNYTLPNPRNLAASTIYKAQTSWATGTAALLTTINGTLPTPLVAGTTYFASNVSTTTSFQLADTSSGAVAGLALSLSTATSVGYGAFKLTPIALVGTSTFTLQSSNDGSTFQNVYVSTQPGLTPQLASVNFASPYTSSSILWNIGAVYYRFLRLAFTAPTSGATVINYVLNGKRK